MIRKILLTILLLPILSEVNSQTPAYLSSFRIAGPNDDTADFIETDSSGNIYVAGKFGSGCDFDPGLGISTLTPAQTTDIFIAKYSPAGSLLWKYPLSGASEFLHCMKLSPAGDIYITGNYYNTLTAFGLASNVGKTTNGGGDAFIAKYDSLGHVLFMLSFGSSNTETAKTITFDANNNFYVGGDFTSGSVDLDPGTGSRIVSNTTINGINGSPFVSKFDASGNFIWAIAPGNTDVASVTAMDVDSSGRLIIGGHFGNSLTVDSAGTVISSAGASVDVYVARYSSEGIYDASWVFGGPVDSDNLYSLITKNDEIVVAGLFMSSMDADPGTGTLTLTSYGNKDIFIVKLDQSGALSWGGHIGGTAGDEATSVKFDNAGDIYLTGFFADSAYFNLTAASNRMNAFSGRDGFVARYSPSGTLVTAMRLGSNGADACENIAFTNAGEFIVTGTYYNNSIHIDPANPSILLQNAGNYDIFIARYSTDSLVTTGIKSVAYTDAKLFPVPANDVINLASEKMTNCVAYVTDITGRRTDTKELEFSKQAQFNIQALVPGIYFIIVKNEEGQTASFRFVKK